MIASNLDPLRAEVSQALSFPLRIFPYTRPFMCACVKRSRKGEGLDSRLSIPTGGGKSLCYAMLPRVFDMLRGNDTPQSLVILVSPALMKDQLRIARIAQLHFLLV